VTGCPVGGSIGAAVTGAAVGFRVGACVVADGAGAEGTGTGRGVTSRSPSPFGNPVLNREGKSRKGRIHVALLLPDAVAAVESEVAAPEPIVSSAKSKRLGRIVLDGQEILVLLLRNNDSCFPLGKEEEARLAASRSSSPCPMALLQGELPEQRSGEDSGSCCRAPRCGLMARRLFRLLVQQPSKLPCCGCTHSSSFLLLRSSLLQDPSQSHFRSSPLTCVCRMPSFPMLIVMTGAAAAPGRSYAQCFLVSCKACARKRAIAKNLATFFAYSEICLGYVHVGKITEYNGEIYNCLPMRDKRHTCSLHCLHCLFERALWAQS